MAAIGPYIGQWQCTPYYCHNFGAKSDKRTLSRWKGTFVSNDNGSDTAGRKIVLVDDDRNILTSVSIALEAEGFNSICYSDGETAWRSLQTHPVDLVVLDIKMPRMNGLDLLQRLREKSQMPVIFLTSKADEVDELTGLRLSADDYITKPFSQRLLIERVRTLLRRTETIDQEPGSRDDMIVRDRPILDRKRHLCTWHGDPVPLTVTEFLILEALAIRPGYVKSRDQLIDAAYGQNVYVDDRTIDSHIKRLRRKFRRSDDEFSEIETLYGVGYRYRAS